LCVSPNLRLEANTARLARYPCWCGACQSDVGCCEHDVRTVRAGDWS